MTSKPSSRPLNERLGWSLSLFGMLGVFAEFERTMIQAWVNAGLAYARPHGTKTGQAIGRPLITADDAG